MLLVLMSMMPSLLQPADSRFPTEPLTFKNEMLFGLNQTLVKSMGFLCFYLFNFNHWVKNKVDQGQIKLW